MVMDVIAEIDFFANSAETGAPIQATRASSRHQNLSGGRTRTVGLDMTGNSKTIMTFEQVVGPLYIPLSSLCHDQQLPNKVRPTIQPLLRLSFRL